MFAKRVFDFLNEEFIGHMYEPHSDEPVEVYINPKSITEMVPFLRAIADNNGNLYVSNDNQHVIHGRLAVWLKSQGYDFTNFEDGIYQQYNNFVLLQRNFNTDDFYLSESYIGNEQYKYANDIKRILKKTKLKNPRFNYIQEKINESLNEMKLENIKKEDIINKETIDYYRGDGFSNELFMYTYAEEYNLNPEEINIEEWQDTPEGIDWINYEIENCFYETMNKFRYQILNENEITIWRKMTVPENWIEHLQKQGLHLGIYWSWDSKTAEEHHGYNKTNYLAHIESSVNVNHIDWINTIRLNMNPTSSDEKEIRLFRNTPLKIKSIKINNEDVDITIIKNKIFKA